MTTKQLIAQVLTGFAILIAVLALMFSIFGLAYLTALSNGKKTVDLTKHCVAQGYDGWIEDFSNEHPDYVGCVNYEEND